MVLMAGVEFPMRAVRQQLSRALDLLVHIERFRDGARKITSITEVQRMESEAIGLQDIFEYHIDPTHVEGGGSLRYTGLRPANTKFDYHGVRLPSWMTAHEFGATDPLPRDGRLESRRSIIDARLSAR
jgi:pilus assembly protein CpaF